jgi:mannose-1-phosphate guanylyltransferase
MKLSRLLKLALAAVAVGALDRADAASAVVLAPAGHLVTSAGQRSVEIAKYDALSTARKKYGANVRLLAASGRSGYGAIVVAGRANGQGSIVTIFLGHPSQAEADRGAIARSLKAGGVNPEVRWRIKG